MACTRRSRLTRRRSWSAAPEARSSTSSSTCAPTRRPVCSMSRSSSAPTTDGRSTCRPTSHMATRPWSTTPRSRTWSAGLYAPQAERGLRWNDPGLGLDWPLPVSRISAKDAELAAARRGSRQLSDFEPAGRSRDHRRPCTGAAGAEGKPIRVAMVGAGFMGRGWPTRSSTAYPGMRWSPSRTGPLDRAEGAYREAGVSRDASRRGRPRRSTRRSPQGWRRSRRLPRSGEAGQVDADRRGDGSGRVRRSCRLAAIDKGKHLCHMNAEVDGTVGPILRRTADGGCGADRLRRRPAGSADEPGPVRSGNRPEATGLRQHQGPAGPLSDARPPRRGSPSKWGQDPHMVTSFADGTKI